MSSSFVNEKLVVFYLCAFPKVRSTVMGKLCLLLMLCNSVKLRCLKHSRIEAVA